MPLLPAGRANTAQAHLPEAHKMPPPPGPVKESHLWHLGWDISNALTWAGPHGAVGEGVARAPTYLRVPSKLQTGVPQGQSTPKIQKRVWGWPDLLTHSHGYPYTPDIAVPVCRVTQGCRAPISALLLGTLDKPLPLSGPQSPHL